MTLFIIASLLLTACQKEPGKPDPEKIRTFTAGNSNIQVVGEVLPGSRISAEEARATVNMAIEVLESRE